MLEIAVKWRGEGPIEFILSTSGLTTLSTAYADTAEVLEMLSDDVTGDFADMSLNQLHRLWPRADFQPQPPWILLETEDNIRDGSTA